MILAVAFLAIKIPYERLYENPMLWERVDNNDGPHIFWLDDDTVEMVNIRYNRENRGFLITERRLHATDARAEMALLGQELGESVSAENSESAFKADRIAAIGDIHGKFKHLVALLERNGIIDSKHDWNWNSGHLVVLGDVFDKGPSVTESLWFLRKLERQARHAGGRLIATCVRLPARDILDEDSQAGFALFEGGRIYRVRLDGQREEL